MLIYNSSKSIVALKLKPPRTMVGRADLENLKVSSKLSKIRPKGNQLSRRSTMKMRVDKLSMIEGQRKKRWTRIKYLEEAINPWANSKTERLMKFKLSITIRETNLSFIEMMKARLSWWTGQIWAINNLIGRKARYRYINHKEASKSRKQIMVAPKNCKRVPWRVA